MYEFIQKAHSGWAYLVALALIIAVVNSLSGFFGKREFKKSDRSIGLFALIAVHVQFVIGVVTYFVSLLGFSSFGQMGNSALRLTSLEHPLVNLIAITLITIGWSKHKKQVDSHAKFKSFAVFYTIGFVLILSRIPWDLWFK